MKIGRDELLALLHLVAVTEAEEIDCDEFLARVSPYLERIVEGGADDSPEYAAVVQHLKVCPECLEEFEALMLALRDGG